MALVFNDPEVIGPDQRIKKCYTLLIVATSDVKCGLANFWRRVTGCGREELPNFGSTYIPRDSYEAFCSAADFAYCGKKLVH